MDGASFGDGQEPVQDIPQDQMGQQPDAATLPMDPNMGEDPGMGDMPTDDMAGGGDDSTMSIINQLSDTDREAVRAYAESMLNRDETQETPNSEMQPQDGNIPMQEGRRVIFKKRQIREMNENFGPTQSELDKNKPQNFTKKTEKNNTNTPFDKPKFN